MNKKIDLINAAYSRARISGLTKQPSGNDVTLALFRLEAMAAMWHDLNMCTGYSFEDSPDPNTPHNVPIKYWNAFASNLAMMLLADFGKTPMPTLVNEANGTYSALASSTAKVKQIQQPRRMPVGSGNARRIGDYQRYYSPATRLPTSCETKHMLVGEVDDFVQHFDAYLQSGETIASYTITNSDDTVLTVSNASNTDNDVSFRATAVKKGTTSLVIAIVTSLGRKEIQYMAFDVLEDN